jgi:hypothetical protein
VDCCGPLLLWSSILVPSNREMQKYNTTLIPESQEASIICLNGHPPGGASSEMH